MPGTHHTLGAAIRDARLRDGLGQRELARLAGISSGYLSRIESDDAGRVSLDAVVALAQGLARPSMLLGVLSGHDYFADVSPMLGLARGLVTTWNQEDQTRIDEGDVDDEFIARVTYEMFVALRFIDVIEQLGFSSDLGSLQQDIARAGKDRARVILAFAAEQAVLGELDRRKSNPASMRLVGELYDPVDEVRLKRIVYRYHEEI